MINVYYVDDLFLLAEQESLIEEIESQLGNKFPLKDLGIPTCFPSMDLKSHSYGSLSISKTEFINKLLMDTGMEKREPLESPIVHLSMVNSADTTTLRSDQHAVYRSIVRNLTYRATRTQRDLAITARMLGSHLQKPTNARSVRGKRELRYLRVTAQYELKIDLEKETQFTAHVLAGWCDEVEKGRRSR